MNSKPTVLELCAGAGGMALGYEQAGFKHLALIEKNENACKTLHYNRPKWNVVKKDVTKIQVWNIYTKHTAPDVIHASTPCQTFSYAGDNEGLGDPRGTIFWDVMRAVQELKPKYIVIENVPGLISNDSGRTLKTMLGVIQEHGYTPTAKVLNAYHFKVAQRRKRLFIVARRNDLPDTFVFPFGHYSGMFLRDALKDCPVSEGYQYSDERRLALSHVPPGGNWTDMPMEVARAYMGRDWNAPGGGSAGLGRRLAWDQPSPTILCQPNGKRTERCHPDETRPLTVRENARIQAFPDDWEFVGMLRSQYTQIGNAVPPPLGRAIATAIKTALELAHKAQISAV